MVFLKWIVNWWMAHRNLKRVAERNARRDKCGLYPWMSEERTQTMRVKVPYGLHMNVNSEVMEVLGLEEGQAVTEDEIDKIKHTSLDLSRYGP